MGAACGQPLKNKVTHSEPGSIRFSLPWIISPQFPDFGARTPDVSLLPIISNHLYLLTTGFLYAFEHTCMCTRTCTHTQSLGLEGSFFFLSQVYWPEEEGKQEPSSHLLVFYQCTGSCISHVESPQLRSYNMCSEVPINTSPPAIFVLKPDSRSQDPGCQVCQGLKVFIQASGSLLSLPSIQPHLTEQGSAGVTQNAGLRERLKEGLHFLIGTVEAKLRTC